MTERPILFNSEMVRAILEGRKIQTRRLVKPQPQKNGGKGFHPVFPYKTPEQRWNWVLDTGMGVNEPFSCPLGKVGDVLWVRETHCIVKGNGIQVRYKADGIPMQTFYPDQPVDGKLKWIPSIHMKRSHSRITLEITDIKVERLNDISAEDAKAEGIFCDPDVYCDKGYPDHFKELWQSVYGQESWNSNPWVWAISFKRIK